MWKDLSNYYQEAFNLAWQSYKKGTIPIGAVILDHGGNIVSRGRNRIFDKRSLNPLARTNMGHAEMTAMIGMKLEDHKNINRYTMISTLEPCPMCFGTMVMMGIRKLNFAARDGFAGASEMNEKLDYIRKKEIEVTNNNNSEMEIFQITLQTSYEYGRNHKRLEEILDTWREYCSEGVDLGRKLYSEDYFSLAVKDNKDISNVYNEVIERFNREHKKID